MNLFDVNISFGSRDDRWRIAAFGHNLTDTEYVLVMGGIARDILSAPISRRGMPRTFGMRAELRWF